MFSNPFIKLLIVSVCLDVSLCQMIQSFDLDFTSAEKDPVTGKLCVYQQVCLANPEELAKLLPQEPCFPEGCNCNTVSDCKGGEPYCSDCKCSNFPPGCDCFNEGDCNGVSPYCVDCKCSQFPPGCSCNIDGDCRNGTAPFCADCVCSAFPQGCDCNSDRDCGGENAFCTDCTCSPFPQGCDCNSDRDCGGANPYCTDCTCGSFPQGCDCNSDRDCGGANPYCTDCTCGAFPQGCDCNSDSDCGGSNPFCTDCTCGAFPAGCDCNSDSDCGGANGFCANCVCSRFPEGCNCNSASDCGGASPYCSDCQCSRFPPGCNCNDVSDCGPEAPNCNNCECSRFPPGCDCEFDGDCGGGDGTCVACVCKDCPVSKSTSNSLLNPPLTFVVDTTKSVKPDKFSIFNLTQRVVERIVEIDANIPNYLLISFNDRGPNFNENVEIKINTPDVIEFKQEIIALRFESFDGGRDSKERLMQGLLAAVQTTAERSLVVVFTDNGSHDLNLKGEIIRLKKERELTVYIVLTPIFEGFPNDPSLGVYEEVADQVFYIAEVGADVFLTTVQNFEETNCV